MQNLDRTHLILWADNPDNITTDVTRVSSLTCSVCSTMLFYQGTSSPSDKADCRETDASLRALFLDQVQ